jgi:hypothetical protein
MPNTLAYFVVASLRQTKTVRMSLTKERIKETHFSIFIHSTKACCLTTNVRLGQTLSFSFPETVWSICRLQASTGIPSWPPGVNVIKHFSFVTDDEA